MTVRQELRSETEGHNSDADAAVTLSDTLSTTTPFASPRGEAPFVGGAASDRTGGGHTWLHAASLTGRAPAPAGRRRSAAALPPNTVPAERNSWLYTSHCCTRPRET